LKTQLSGAVLFILFITNISFSQIKFSIGPVIGYTSPAGDLSGTTMDYYNGSKYGLNGSVNFGAQAKLKLLVINAKASVMYTSLSNTGNSEPGQGSVETNMKLLTFALGTEFHLPVPLIPVNPYIGAELLFTNFKGETVFTGVSRVPSGTYTLSSASRTGLGFGAGVEISFGKKSSLDLGIKYNMYNLFGKSFSGGDDRIFSYTSLNDEADPQYSVDPDKHPISGSRIISAVQFNLSYLFDF
jgi:opacity protein-like surface antigen